MNIEKPLLEEKVYSNKKPLGYHTIKVWENEKEKGKYSFSISNECRSDVSHALATLAKSHRLGNSKLQKTHC